MNIGEKMQIVLDKVNYIYNQGNVDETYALKDINLVINKGEMIGIIGHTGSGKSTLIQQLNGLMKASSGDIYYEGINIYDKDYNLRDLRSKVGVVFQHPEYQLFETTVYKDVYFGPSKQDITTLEAQKRAFDAIKLVGLGEDMLDVSPFELSGGQKRKVAIAGILAMAPDVLVLDEPTAGLDPQSRREILNLLKQLNEEVGMTIIMVSHSMEDVAEYAKRIIVMDNGSIRFDDTPANVFDNRQELESMGLAVPQMREIVDGLTTLGIHIPKDRLTVDKVCEELYRIMM